jgi:DNA repair exonuclease SbcCD nuclease subunit
MKLKIAHFADTHLGYRQYGLAERENDFYERFDEIIDHMIENDVDCVIHSGDLFESPKPPIKALLTAQQGFMRLVSHNIPVYVIAGNHDKMQKSNTEIPQRLFENECFHILEKGKTYAINDDVFIGGLQYLPPQYQDQISDFANEIKEEAKDYRYKILVLHGGLEKFDDYTKDFELNSIPDNFDYYAMGHIHRRYISTFKDGMMCYPGSTELRTKKELDDYNKNGKGYTLVTIDDDKDELDISHVNLPLKREYIIKKIKYPQLEEKLYEINEMIDALDEQPILDLTVEEGNFEKSDVLEKIDEIIGEKALSIRCVCNTIKDDETGPIKDVELTPEKALKKRIIENYGENQNIINLTTSLYRELSIPNQEEALNITEDYFEKNYGGE